MPASSMDTQFVSQLFLKSSALVMTLEKQQTVVELFGAQLPPWET